MSRTLNPGYESISFLLGTRPPFLRLSSRVIYVHQVCQLVVNAHFGGLVALIVVIALFPLRRQLLLAIRRGQLLYWYEFDIPKDSVPEAQFP